MRSRHPPKEKTHPRTRKDYKLKGLRNTESTVIAPEHLDNRSGIPDRRRNQLTGITAGTCGGETQTIQVAPENIQSKVRMVKVKQRKEER